MDTGLSLRKRQLGLGRGGGDRRRIGSKTPVLGDGAHDRRVGQERQHPPPATAVLTDQHVDLEDTFDQR